MMQCVLYMQKHRDRWKSEKSVENLLNVVVGCNVAMMFSICCLFGLEECRSRHKFINTSNFIL